MKPIAQMADGADGKDKVYIGIHPYNTLYKSYVLRYNLLHIKPTTHESPFGQLVTITYHTVRLTMKINVCCTKSNEHDMGFTKHFASPQQTSIDALHTGFTRIRRKASMVHQTMPLTLVFNQFGGRFFIPPSVQHLIDGLGYAQGIIENAKGIDVAREFIFHKSCSNVFRKARTHEQK
jgi:hypothetical protein